ncbi:hypothetical protein ACSBR2_018213 [Camellia fascicularis]
MQNVVIHRGRSTDTLVWNSPSSGGTFSIKSLHCILKDSLHLTPFPVMKLWKSVAPPRIKAFGWLVWWNRIASSDLLFKRHIIPAPNLCAFYGLEEGNSSHLLLQCQFSWQCGGMDKNSNVWGNSYGSITISNPVDSVDCKK